MGGVGFWLNLGVRGTPIPSGIVCGEYTVYIYESRIVDFICYMMLDELMSADP